MLKNEQVAADTNENDKLMAALAYLLSPVVPIVILVVESMKGRPFQRYHAIQGLGLGAIVVIASVLLSITVVGCCLIPILYIPIIFYTYKAYKGTYFEIPGLTQFMIQQGWLQAPPQA